jgi:hypothetical protein
MPCCRRDTSKIFRNRNNGTTRRSDRLYRYDHPLSINIPRSVNSLYLVGAVVAHKDDIESSRLIKFKKHSFNRWANRNESQPPPPARTTRTPESHPYNLKKSKLGKTNRPTPPPNCQKRNGPRCKKKRIERPPNAPETNTKSTSAAWRKRSWISEYR